MKNTLYNLFSVGSSIGVWQLLLHLSMASCMGLAIFFSYWITHAGSIYSKKFNVSLIMLTILTATVVTVIGNNIALSLGMVGALSIVRYRTAVKDSRDTAYIFWSVVAGICCGVGDFTIAAFGTSFVFLLLLLLGRVKNDNRLLLVVRAPRSLERAIESIVFARFDRRASLRVKNTSGDSIEMIYEISRKLYEHSQLSAVGAVDQIYALGKIDYVNIVAQNDDIV